MEPHLDQLPAAVPYLLTVIGAIYVAGVLWFASGIGGHVSTTAEEPFVSIVIAARDEAEQLESCVGRLLNQSYPRSKFEIVLIDDGSTDATGQIAKGLCARHDQIKCLPAENGGSKKQALETGVAVCRGSIVLTTDAHCAVPASWVADLVSCFAPDVGLVIGYSETVGRGSDLGWLQGWEAVDFLCLMGSAAGSAGHGRALGASGQSLAFRKSAFEEVGGYERVKHRASGDDVLLLHLIRRHTKWRAVFSGGGAPVIHPAVPTWKSLSSKRARWASNAPYQLLLNPAFFIYLLNSFALSLAVVALPLLVGTGLVNWRWAVGIFLVKILAEAVLFTRAAEHFERADLRRFFPLWVLMLPLYTVYVGVLGALGRFRWKDTGYAWGRSARSVVQDV
jgi:cellulose synthase/poly-beta-1,6-N-acetylglucosamine synthase-like glycosyltransferase